MSVPKAEQLAREMIEAVQHPGQLKRWLQQHDATEESATALAEACVIVTETMLSEDPPDTAAWEQFLISLAVHAHDTPQQVGLSQCKSAIQKLLEMLESDRFASVDPRKMATIAGALTIVLTAEAKLRQPVEEAMKSLCDRFDDQMELMGQRCQDIWRRKGQMSGEAGLFCWDTRHQQWRLAQDFKFYRPE